MPPIVVTGAPSLPLGMPPADFLRDYWQKRPLLIRGAFAEMRCPLTPEDLAGLACEELALARLVEQDRARDQWRCRQGPFVEADFPELPERDWTLLVQDVDRWDPDVRALLAHFDFLPRWRIDDVMVSFAAPGGSVGAHVDQYDVFLLQGQGHRRWQIDARKNPPRAYQDDVELKLLRTFRPSHDWLLAPGDMLYLPPGVPHHGIAEDACLTFSIGMRAPAVAELMGDFADHLADTLSDDVRYADPDLRPPGNQHEIDPSAIARVRALLQTQIGRGDAELTAWLGSFLTRYRSSAGSLAPPRPPTRARWQAALAKGGHLVHHPFARFAWARAGRDAQLFAHGQVWRLGVSQAKRLCEPRPLAAADLQAWPETAHTVLDALLASGALVIQRARS